MAVTARVIMPTTIKVKRQSRTVSSQPFNWENIIVPTAIPEDMIPDIIARRVVNHRIEIDDMGTIVPPMPIPFNKP